MHRFVLVLWLWTALASSLVAQPSPMKRGLFVAPGAFVPPQAYEALVNRVRDLLGEEAEVVYAQYAGDFPLAATTNRQLAGFYHSMVQRGYDPDITVLGHSQGGLAIGALPRGLYARVVLMASYVQTDWLSNGPFPWDGPVLSLSGTLDVLTTPERVAFDAYRFAGNKLLETILIEGVNHSQFANGQYGHTDRDSPLTHDVALDEISKFIAAFIRADLPGLGSEALYRLSKALIEGYRTSFDLDQAACRDAQLGHLGDIPVNSIDINLTRYGNKRSYPRFILDKSYVETEPQKTTIHIFQFEERRIAPVDIAPLQASTPEVIACKLRSREALRDFAGDAGHGRSCAELNLEVLRQSFALLPQMRKDRLLERGINLDSREIQVSRRGNQEILRGPGFEVVDTSRARGEQWALGSFLKVSKDSDRLGVQTFSVTTPVGNPDNRFLGAFYCKLVAPSRAFQLLDEMSR